MYMAYGVDFFFGIPKIRTSPFFPITLLHDTYFFWGGYETLDGMVILTKNSPKKKVPCLGWVSYDDPGGILEKVTPQKSSKLLRTLKNMWDTKYMIMDMDV